MTKKFHIEIFATTKLRIPVVALAQQSNDGLTRAQVRAERVQLEAVDYVPKRHNDPHYPADIQAATSRLKTTARLTNETSGYGGDPVGFSPSGTSATARPVERSIYSGR